MKFQSLIISRGSGSIGGLTYSHNKGGNYIRARVTPTNTNTALQAAVRNAMGSLGVIWGDILTQVQRNGWANYAANVPLLDQFGDPRNVTALNMYQRCNIPRIQAGLDRVDDAPTTYNLGDVGVVSVAFTAAGNAILVTFDDTDEWLDETGSALLIYCGRAQNPGITYYKSPFRLSKQVLGDDTTPPTSPAAGVSNYAIATGQRVFWRATVTRVDGRLSQTLTGNAIAT